MALGFAGRSTLTKPDRRFFACSVLFLLALFMLYPPRGESGPREGYVGSQACSPCHQIQYKGWVNTFHSTVVQDAKANPSVVMGDMSVPDLPFKREDIVLTIGGHWDQRYLTRIDDEFYVLPRLWSVQSKKWRPYSTWGWQRRPYSKYCVGCHSVGFNPKTKQIVEHSVGCESCHGPGSRHSGNPSGGNIVNPRRLSEDRAEEICASCHVRGKDITGEYFFPIGYEPGSELSRFLVPLEKKEGEINEQAIHRLWDQWRSDREAQARSRCEVCGIHQNKMPRGEKVTVDAICMSCHEYGEKLTEHTRHGKATEIGCVDCHVQKPAELNESKDENVHSYGFFLIHSQGCWDKNIQAQCGKCHQGKTEEWAYGILSGWGKTVIVDH